MAMLMLPDMAPNPKTGKFLTQLALSDVAGEIAKLLREAYEIQGGAKPDFVTSRQIRATADRMVALQAPSARENALTAANKALAETVAMVRHEAARSYSDHSSALLVNDALETMGAVVGRIGAGHILSAFDAALEGSR